VTPRPCRSTWDWARRGTVRTGTQNAMPSARRPRRRPKRRTQRIRFAPPPTRALASVQCLGPQGNFCSPTRGGPGERGTRDRSGSRPCCRPPPEHGAHTRGQVTPPAPFASLICVELHREAGAGGDLQEDLGQLHSRSGLSGARRATRLGGRPACPGRSRPAQFAVHRLQADVGWCGRRAATAW